MSHPDADPEDHDVNDAAPELLRDLDRRNSFHLYIGSTPQSHVDLDDPTYLEYEYIRQIAHVIDLMAPEREPLRALHLGGGGLTLARYIAATRPGSGQQVVEIDAALLDLIRKELPLPKNARVRLRNGDARDVMSRVPEGAFDLTVTDVFSEHRIPAHCASIEYAEASKRALRPGGIHTANLADGYSGLRFAQTQVANAQATFRNVVLIADPRILRGRRFGNLVLIASDAELPLAGLVRRTASDPFPSRVVHGDDLVSFTGGVKPVHDADAVQSPERPGDVLRLKKR
jgi:spermidine synthase